MESFAVAVQNFVDDALVHLDKGNDLAVRRLNDKLMLLERFFIDSQGLPERPEKK